MKFRPDIVALVDSLRPNGIKAQAFLAHYESNGWKVGKNPMRNWKAAVVTWENKERN